MAYVIGQEDGLSSEQLTVFQELEFTFPNLNKTLLKDTVLETTTYITSIEDSLLRCMEVLVGFSPSDCDRKQSVLLHGDTVLSNLQEEVLTHLTQIFPNYEMKVIRTAVRHPSNLHEPLDKPTLLQRCIDDLLDGRTAIEAGSDWEDNAESLVELRQDNPEEDVSVTMVEESKDVLITGTEKAKDFTILDDDYWLPLAEQVVKVKSASFHPSAEHTINVIEEQNNNKTSKTSTPTCVKIAKLKTGLTTDTAHISLVETEDETKVPDIPRSGMCSKPDTQPRNVNSKQTENVAPSVPAAGVSSSDTYKCPEPKTVLALDSLSSPSKLSTSLSTEIPSMSAMFNLSRDDTYSSRTFDFSSDSQSSASSVDSVPYDDDLPTITFPKNIHNEFMTPSRFRPDVKLERTALNVNAHLPPLPSCSSSNSTYAEHSRSSFKLESSKFTFSPSSKQRTADHSTRTSDVPQMNAMQTHGLNKIPGQTNEFVNVKQLPGLMQGIDPSAKTIMESCAVDAIPSLPTTATTCKPVATTKCHTTTWTPPRTPPRKSTVTIKSTHKITYNTPLHEIIGDHGAARPKYSAPGPNILVQLPLEPEIEFMDTSSTPSSQNTETNPLHESDTDWHPMFEWPQFEKCNGCNAYYNKDEIIAHCTKCERWQVLANYDALDNTSYKFPGPVKADQRMNPNDAILPNRYKFADGHDGYENSRNMVNSRGKLQANGVSTIEGDKVALLNAKKLKEERKYNVRYENGKLQAKPEERYTQKLPGNAAVTTSKTNDLRNNQSHNVRPQPLTKALLRPSVLSKMATGTAVVASTAPSVVKSIMKTSAGGAGSKAPVKASSIWRTSGATYTVPNPATVLDPTPFNIPHEPADMAIRQPAPAPILIAEVPVRPVQVFPATIPDDPTVAVKNGVLALFPDVEPDHLDMLSRQHIGPMAVNNICFILLESKYPKKAKECVSAKKADMVPETQYIDYFKDYSSVVIPEDLLTTYSAQTFHLLSQDFPWLAVNDIKAVMKKVRNYYSPSYKALHTVWHMATTLNKEFRGLVFPVVIPASEAGGAEYKLAVKLLKNRRSVVTKTNIKLVPGLQREVDFVKQWLKDTETEEDHQVALAINEQEYEDQGQCIECGCCYGEYPFEQIVQCYEGHLFCENCLRQYAKESVFGQGKADLKCMTELCDSEFPKSQLLKALPYEMLAKYEDRVLEENLNLADIGDLVKCPHCDFRAFMDPDDKVFRCQMDACRMESCRYCHVEWAEHFGKKCSEVEKNDETKLRLEYEEKMTKAKVRVCHRCKAQFMKEDGCNKMTCRCGAKMCYICRLPDIDYNHFCRHPRDPGKECTSCKACNLWTNPEEDDDRAIAEMQKEAEEERKKKGFTETKVIGVPDQPPKKKVKR